MRTFYEAWNTAGVIQQLPSAELSQGQILQLPSAKMDTEANRHSVVTTHVHAVEAWDNFADNTLVRVAAD